MKTVFLILIVLISCMQDANAQISQPKTLLEIGGIESKPRKLSESVLVIVDAQKEFTEGKLKLLTELTMAFERGENCYRKFKSK